MIMITDHDYCELSTELTQQSGGLGISSQMDSSEWFLCQNVFCNLRLKLGTPAVNYSLKSVTLSSTICGMETRSLQRSHGLNVNYLDTGSLLSISPILYDPPCAKQNTARPSTHSNIDSTLLVNTVVISISAGNVNKEITSNTKFNHTLSRSKRESHPLVLIKTLILVAW